MNVKKIIAPTMQAALAKVKDELGDQAVILHSKMIYDGGFLGLFKKKKYEVIAALDENPVIPKPTVKNKQRKIPQQANVEVRQAQTGVADNVLAELATLKKELKTVKREPFFIRHFPEPIQACLLHLQKADVADQHIEEIGQQLLEKWRQSPTPPEQADVFSWCKNIMIERLGPFQYKEINEMKKYINVVGPTGAGKTTTLAKLAAVAVLEHKKRVALITVDTYRIAAIDQLKTYAELLQLPLEIAYDQHDFSEAIKKFADYDLVLIDTAGRNYRELEFVHDLKGMFGETEMETLLALPISMKEKDLEIIVNHFQQLPFNYFLFTKADETRSYGAMYNLIVDNQRGVTYITTGQEVPDDMIAASPERIAHYVLEDETI
ncbi:flagellar biosynthesis protein FlhF [Bacillus sp. FJAT-50079]|uniref:flagellar biosynthesis protein FlhF n=1 Tax=Bacillus sp. FJAT-50079 TaxID=2833577 RepID=UPI001BC97D15|nr:flagellar biosynthesis protein FlhF [Bacillus sp. FJAT-50079]MBS4207606.1 flagellar biosynthesis protein FlhF [Bacillus sp. FJAT-50079]